LLLQLIEVLLHLLQPLPKIRERIISVQAISLLYVHYWFSSLIKMN
jgi:hypothetical protein